MKLVKQACFQSATVADEFANGCRTVGMKALVLTLFSRDWKRRAGYLVKWAPTWEHFQHDC